MIIKCRKISIDETIFYAAYYIYIIYNMLRTTFLIKNIETFNLVVYVTVTGLLLIKVLFDIKGKMNVYLLIFSMMGFVGSTIVLFLWKKLIPIVLILFIITVKNIDFNHLAKKTLQILLFFLVTVQVFYKMGVINTNIDVYGRNSIGFTYSTMCSHFFLALVLLSIYVYKEKLKFFHWIMILSANLYIFVNTRARNSFGLVLITFVLFIIMKRSNVLKRIFRRNVFAEYSILIAQVISLLVMLFYNSSSLVWAKMNAILSGRLSLMKNAFMEYGIPLFGCDIEWKFEAGNYNYIDNSFYQICLLYGWVFLICLVFGTFVLMRKMKMDQNYYGIMIFDIIIVHSIIDPQFYQLAYNPFLLLIGVYAWQNRKNMKRYSDV